MITASFQTNPYGNIFNSTTIKSKCSAFTQSGYQFSRNAKDGDMYCSQYTRSNREQGLEPAANDCMGTTKSERACRNKAKNGMYCGHHDPEKKILGKLD